MGLRGLRNSHSILLPFFENRSFFLVFDKIRDHISLSNRFLPSLSNRFWMEKDILLLKTDWLEMCWSIVCLVGKVQWPKVIKVVYAPNKHTYSEPPIISDKSLNLTDYVVFWKNKLEHFAWKKKLRYALEGKGDSQWNILYFFPFSSVHLSIPETPCSVFKNVHIEERFQKLSRTIFI